MLQLQQVAWKAEDGQPILQDITLDLPDGKMICLTGPNGGGKTTLARLIAGLEQPTQGKILFNGQDITNATITQRAHAGISYAFQQPVRFRGLTVRDLLTIAHPQPQDEQQLCTLLSQVGLCARDYLDRQVDTTLSGGEIKRIEIATVLARGANTLIFDEPEAGIDLWSFNSLVDVFENIKENLQGNLIIISHQERILQASDLIAVIADGRVSRFGPTQQLLPQLLGQQPACGYCPKGREVNP